MSLFGRFGEKMRLKIDNESDTLYLRLNETPVIASEEMQPGVIFDYDENGCVVGIEILGLSTCVEPEKLHILQLETT